MEEREKAPPHPTVPGLFQRQWANPRAYIHWPDDKPAINARRKAIQATDSFTIDAISTYRCPDHKEAVRVLLARVGTASMGTMRTIRAMPCSIWTGELGCKSIKEGWWAAQ